MKEPCGSFEKYLEPDLEKIVKQFNYEGTLMAGKPIVSGHINNTYLIGTNEKNKPDYILQKINDTVFKNIPELQDNILRVTNHIRNKLLFKNDPDAERKVIRLIPAQNGQWYIQDGNQNFWRMFVFISSSHSYNKIFSSNLAFEAGYAFGEFGSYLTDMPGGPLFETIKDFHNIEWRLQQFKDAIELNNGKRLDLVQDEIKWVKERANEMCKLQRLIREGKLPRRVVHCDTKINNILFDDNDKALCVIDLDTVMSGHITSDFGDAVRTITNTGAEDDPVLSNISINLDYFRAYSEGFISVSANFLTKIEIENLAFSAKLFAYMQAVRFLVDFIDGDRYYKIRHPMHNLQRAKAQFKLLFSIEDNYKEICRIVKNAVK